MAANSAGEIARDIVSIAAAMASNDVVAIKRDRGSGK